MLAKFTVDFGGVNYPLPYKNPDTLYVGFVAVFSGCKRALFGNPCPDCQNPSLWGNLDWDGDRHQWITSFVQRKYELMMRVNPDVEFFYCMLGGEPLDQNYRELIAIHEAVMRGCRHAITTVLYTGYESYKAQYIGNYKSQYIKDCVDYIKLGAYLGNKYRRNDLTSGLATPNQRWVQNTRLQPYF